MEEEGRGEGRPGFAFEIYGHLNIESTSINSRIGSERGFVDCRLR